MKSATIFEYFISETKRKKENLIAERTIFCKKVKKNDKTADRRKGVRDNDEGYMFPVPNGSTYLLLKSRI